MYRYSFSLLMSLLACFAVVAQTENVEPDTAPPPVELNKYGQFRVGVDLSKIARNFFFKNQYSFEISLDYYYKNELYFVLEGGYGGSDITYTDLWYKSQNSFLRIGIDKTMTPRLFTRDMDMLFIGLRYGISSISRTEAGYVILDDFWGNSMGTIPAKSFMGHWAEITGGMRVELGKGLFAGYNIRAKFLINQKPFRELPPAYVAGYGNGEKTTAFDFNFYLQYAFRWKRSK